MAVTKQEILRDVLEMLKTRGIRLAALLGTSSDIYSIYIHDNAAGNLAQPASGTIRIVIDFDQDKLDELDERAVGSTHTVIPTPGRV